MSNEWDRDPDPGQLGKLLVAACLAIIAVMLTTSVVGMTGALDRIHNALPADGCEAVAEFCDEVNR
jgi:hypothetical protein